VTGLLPLLRDNLLSPPILFFALGVGARIARSDLEVPREVGRALAIYLMMSIGFKGGTALASGGVSWTLAAGCAAVVLLGTPLTVIAFALLRWAVGVDAANAASVAAHYGSVSAVTFLTAAAFLDRLGEPYEWYLVALMALMEIPAIFVGLFLARVLAPERGSTAPERDSWPDVLREALFNGSVILLAGSLVIGAIAGAEGGRSLEAFLVAPFQGVLALFLLDMGLLAARRAADFRRMGGRLVAFGVAMPLLGAPLGLITGRLLGLGTGGMTLLAVLAASASYIAVPAAMRLGLPQANPGLGVSLALGVTFPLNIVFGLPLYYQMARLLANQ
jgi:hypothetical protein